MRDETPPQDETERQEGGRGRLAGVALRILDACLQRLQELRNRIEPPAGEDESRSGRGRRGGAAAETPAAARPPRSLLRRALTVVLAVALGASVASFMAYRGFAQLIASQEALIDYQQDEIDAAHKQEAINNNARAKAQNEAADYRKRVREMQLELEDRNARIDQLDQQVIALSKRLTRPAFTATGAPRSGAVPNKTGSCITGTTNTPGQVLDCIDKFNRP